MEGNSSRRRENIEILRIFSMLMIIVGHYLYWGLRRIRDLDGFNILDLSDCCNYISLEFLSLLASTGVNCFVMITGYFMIEKYTWRWKGIIRTWIEMAFYICIIGTFTFITFPEAINIKDVAKSILLFPPCYWFIRCYIALLLVAPILSRVLSFLTKKEYLIVLLLLFILTFRYGYGELFAGTQSLGWFIFLFSVSGYLRKYSVPHWWIRNKTKVLLLVWLALFLLATATKFVKLALYGNATFMLTFMGNNDFEFFLSLTLFVWFVNTPMKSQVSKKLAVYGKFMFGVYLIHMNPFCYKQVWNIIMPNSYNMPIIINCFMICIAILILCTAIDYCRHIGFKIMRIYSLEDSMSKYFPSLHDPKP